MPLRYFLAVSCLLISCASDTVPEPLVGVWRAADGDSAAMHRYVFSSDGRLTIELPDTTVAATFAVERDSVLTLTSTHEQDQVIAHIAGDTLLLRTADGVVGRFLRLSD